MEPAERAQNAGTTETLIRAGSLQVSLRRKRILDSVDLNVGLGVCGLLGPNGAGKTTLMRTLATAIPTSGGQLELLCSELRPGERPSRELRRAIGFCPQTPLVLRHLTVAQQVEYAGWLKGMSGEALSAAVACSLEAVDLSERATSRTKTLSGGMLRRLGIAMALVAEPKVLLLDEPTAGLDPEQRIAFRKLVVDLGRTKAVMLSTHLVEDVVAACDRVVVMSGGRTVFQGTAAELAIHAPEGADNDRSPVEAGFAYLVGSKQFHRERAR